MIYQRVVKYLFLIIEKIENFRTSPIYLLLYECFDGGIDVFNSHQQFQSMYF